MRSVRGRRGYAGKEVVDGKIEIPDLSLVLLVGASGCGKSTFARKHFLATEILSSDQCRGIVSDDENAQEATGDAFDLLRYIARLRLRNAKMVVVDATNVQENARKEMLQLAWEFHVPAVAIVFHMREEICHERNASRPDRQFGPHVVRNQTRDLRRSLPGLFREGFRHVYVFKSLEEVETANIVRTPMWPDFRDISGPFDVIGDVHGCFDELSELLEKLGYSVTGAGSQATAGGPEFDLRSLGLRPDGRWKPRTYYEISHPENRKLIFLGDLVDRGPKSPEVLKLAMSVVASGIGFCVPGNHDDKLIRKLRGKDVRIAHGLAETLEQLERESGSENESVEREALSVEISEGAQPPPSSPLRGTSPIVGERDESNQPTPPPPLRVGRFSDDVADFLDSLVSHMVLDDGKLVVAHAGMKEEMQGRASTRVRDFALYGETTGETDEFGLPVRYNWAAEYRGKARMVYGHTPVPKPDWLNRTINIDTGCVFGGSLTALRYPEMEMVSVQSREMYAESKKPFLEQAPVMSAQHEQDDVLDLEDVFGKRIVSTRLRGNITIREENASAALEAMSRFAASPKWMVYLPPTMSPTETTLTEGLLEHPAEGFAYFRENAVARVVCEEKHMGSRAVVVVCRDAEVAKTRFGVVTGESGCIYTRTGRRFFDRNLMGPRSSHLSSPSPTVPPSAHEPSLQGEPGGGIQGSDKNSQVAHEPLRQGEASGGFTDMESAVLERVRNAIASAGVWDQLSTDWMILDCELMPWSAKAQELLTKQYAPVGSSSTHATRAAIAVLEKASELLPDTHELLERVRSRAIAAEKYVDAYRKYCWPVSSIEDLRLAPFHILATEGAVHADKDHVWHMETLAHICAQESSLLFATPYKIVETEDEDSVREGIAWWEELTGRGGEGMVIKPLTFVSDGPRGLVQPAVKCRGREYLRIIYGPEYTLPENLSRLRKRGLGVKRSLALREFALGIEGLERFVRKEPLRQVHECVFAVLAMESEPVDPRL